MKTFSKLLSSEEELLFFGSQLAFAIPTSAIIFLQGELGAGKTTLTRGFLGGLGISGKIKSPTYTLVETYQLNEQNIYHFDLYRLNNPSELHHIGIEDYFADNGIYLIEWAEKGEGVLPTPDIICQIEFHDDGRLIEVTASSEEGQRILRNLVAQDIA